ncbi:MAG: hypothetical protein HXX19_19285 [Rhodoferax sp.]|nr:hypothetical protein [Rhodoferax sp.]
MLPAPGSLLTHVIMGANGQALDTTGHSVYSVTGDVSVRSAAIAPALYVDRQCP